MDIYDHELESYHLEINRLEEELASVLEGNYKNLTHASLGISNRGHLLVIGLCSLVEAFLYELACENKIKNVSGLRKITEKLDKSGVVNFENIHHWKQFDCIYDLRNILIHSYGGLVDSTKTSKINKVLCSLNIEDSLVGGRRIRININVLSDFKDIIKNVINELKLSFKFEVQQK